MIYGIYALIVITLIVRAYLRKEELICSKITLELRASAKVVLDSDIKRCTLSFYEKYLFVYDKSNTIPTDDKFIEFRDSFLIFFRSTVGNKQCLIYDEIFGGSIHFDYYLNNEFEKYFKQVFIAKLIKHVAEKE